MSQVPSSSFPPRFRRRIAIAFIAVAGLSAGALALGAAVTVDSYRTASFLDRARSDANDDLRLLAAGARPDVVAGRLADAQQPGGPAVLVLSEGEVLSSVESVDLGDVPPDVRRAAHAEPGVPAEGGTTLPSGSTLVIGAVLEDPAVEAYFFFPREELERSIRELRVTLAVGWLIVVIVAGVAGTLVARRTLRPVRNAADAARSVAEGLLDTRLPIGSSDEFGEWAAAFNEMVAALEEKIAALAEARDREHRFAADVAHELRTPIAAILTAASHLADDAAVSPDEARDIGRIIATAARRLDRLTSELLELHRLEARQVDVQVEDVDLGTAVRQAVSANGWEERVECAPTTPVVVATDRRRLDRIIVNLVSNAVRHGGDRIRVAVSPAADGAWITVSDDGPGIPAEDLPRVFDRHYKVSRDRSTGADDGSGLGLAIAYESAERLDGSLAVSSTEGVGTTFTLWLPSEPATAPGNGSVQPGSYR